MRTTSLKPLFLPIIILVIGFTIACERDDICPESTPTTPSLIITAYNDTLQEDKKNIFNLVIKGFGNDSFLEEYKVISTDSIVLPLNTIDNTSVYKIYSDSSINDNDTSADESDDVVSGNEDIITITYKTEQVYVSRACGYKTIFKEVSINIEDDGNLWIKSIQPENNNQSVEDEKSAHFKLFH